MGEHYSDFLIKTDTIVPNQQIQFSNQFENELLKSNNDYKEELLKKISQEIHDNISPFLTLIKWNLSAIDDSENIHIEESKLFIEEAITALRTLSQSINGDFLLKEGLNAAVLKLSNSYNSLKHVACYYENTINSDLPICANNELIIYRCIQEIVNNAVKHSEADEIKIIFSQTESFFIVLITDNGKGFDTSYAKNNGIGLNNIQERMSLINGQFQINSIITEGTQIILSIPITY